MTPEDEGFAAALGKRGFILSVEFFTQAPLDRAQQSFADLLREQQLISRLLDRRICTERTERCSYCGEEFGPHNPFYGRQPYVEAGVHKVLLTCRNLNCVTAFNDRVAALQKERVLR